MSGEPLTLTLEEALAELQEKGLKLVPPDWRADSWGTVRIKNQAGPEHEFDTWPEAVSEALGVPVVARDDAAHLEAELSKWWSAYVEVAGFLGMVSTDDTGRVGAVAGMEEVLAELEQREKDAAELKAALTEWAAAKNHFEQIGVDWRATVNRGEWSREDRVAHSRAAERVIFAERALHRLAEQDKEETP